MTLFHKRTILILLAGMSAAGIAAAAPVLQLSTAATAATPAFTPEIDVKAGGSTTYSLVTYSNVGSGALNLTFTPSAAFITASTAAGCNTGCPINIAVNASGLSIGSYTEFITVNDPAAVDSPQTIALLVKVLGVTPNLTLYAAPNGGMATATFETQSPVNAQPSVASGGNWLSVSLAGTGSYTTYFPYQVQATTQPGQAAGDYNGSINVSGSNYAPDNQTVNVLLHVTASPIISPAPAQLALSTGQGLTTTANISLANAGEGSLQVTGATATYSNGSGWLTTSVSSGGGNVAVTADASNLTPGIYQGTVTISSNAVNPAAIPVTLLVTAQSGPLIGFNGVVNIGSNTPALAPGDIASVYGTNLTAGSTPLVASTTPLPTSLGGVQVLVNGTAAGLYYSSNNQINFQVPYELDVTTTPVVQVTYNGSNSNLISATAKPRQPEILLFYTAGTPPVIVDYTTSSIPTTLVTGSTIPSAPAHAGDTLVLYAVGLGVTAPSIADLVAAPSSPLAEIANSTVTITVGGIFDTPVVITPAFAGLAPGFASLYQINFVLPANTPLGDNVNVTIATTDEALAVVSNNVEIAVH